MHLTATYSPDDNKLRLYSDTRLDRETYDRLKEAGFVYAARQELFVAPMWTPAREDLLEELAGEITDEDDSLLDRAEDRAERFGEYADHRQEDGNAAYDRVQAICDRIPFGQPILVGHHSEKSARADQKRIEQGMDKACRMWETSRYWERRAKAAVQHAKYKERPDVRARRIKTIEADLRKKQREKKDAEAKLALWTNPNLTQERAIWLAGNTECGYLRLPRKEGDKEDWDIQPTAYDGLTNHHPTLYAPRTLAEVVAAAQETYPRLIANCDRWIQHYEFRLAYERAMLNEAGGTVTDRKGPEVGGACRCWCSPAHGQGWSLIVKVNKTSVTLRDNWGNGGPDFTRTIPFDKLRAVMTKAEVDTARMEGRIAGENARGFFLS